MEHEPIFFIGPSGPLQMNASWGKMVAEFCNGVKIAVGSHATWRLRPYRLGPAAYLAFDIKGNAGEVSLTLIESGVSRLPDMTTICSTRDVECELADIVDCYYLVASVLESLETLGAAEFSALAGPNTITK